MKQLWERIMQSEPAVLWGLVRAIVYIIIGATGAAIAPEDLEAILTVLAGLVGIDAATTAATRARVYSPKTASDLLATVFVGQVGEYLQKVVSDTLPRSKVTDGLRVVAPLLVEFAQAQLTTETRAEIQKKAHLMLRKAGLMKQRNVGTITQLLALVGILVVLPGCAVVTDFFGSTVDVLVGDTATLKVVDTGLQFDPGHATAEGVVVTIYALAIGTIDERCTTERLEAEELVEAVCLLGDVPEPTVITLAAEGVTADATWTRPGSPRPYGTQLR